MTIGWGGCKEISIVIEVEFLLIMIIDSILDLMTPLKFFVPTISVELSETIDANE